jgi:phosphoglycolate phosphatase
MHASQPTVLLFDIDGTLLSSDGAGRRAMTRAFAEVTGHDDAFAFSFDGMTDRAIVRQALVAVGAFAQQRVEAVLQVYVERLGEELAAARDYRVHVGVMAALESVSCRPGVAVGLGTGNIREGAMLKLGHVRLDGYFAFGGFGSDHEERAEILRTGAARGAQLFGCVSAQCRVVVIGDTPRDIAAARAVGAESIGVGTGRFDAASLLAAGATWAFATLASEGARQALLRER